MRVISGICRGRKLVPIQGSRIRPTSDRVKEAVYNILGPAIKGARVLDLFSGTGALGIEALSRGAEHAVFMDIQTSTTKENILLCGLEENARIISSDILGSDGFAPIQGQTFNFIFIDPPYGKQYIEQVFEKDLFSSLITKDSIIIAEHPVKENLEISHTGLDIFRQKKYSKTMISLIQKSKRTPDHA